MSADALASAGMAARITQRLLLFRSDDESRLLLDELAFEDEPRFEEPACAECCERL